MTVENCTYLFFNFSDKWGIASAYMGKSQIIIYFSLNFSFMSFTNAVMWLFFLLIYRNSL